MNLFKQLPQADALIDALNAIFSDRIAHKITPATSFAVFDASGIVLQNGFGDAGTAGHLPRPEVRFRIASCTKSFTAAAILLLRDRGQLSLDDVVTCYAPALQMPWPETFATAPSIRQLMAMAGGFPTDDPWADRQESLGTDEFDAVLRAGARFATLPGTRFEYSNLGYALLGRVIEQVSGQSYVDFVTENLFEPLGLTATGFDPAEVPAEVMATGFRKVDDNWLALPFSGPGAFSAIGGIVTTTGDLARWAQWLLAAFDASAPASGPLSPASRREMQTIQCVIDQEPVEQTVAKGYGFGLRIEHHAQFGPIICHSGGYPGFSAHMRWSSKYGLGVLAFDNATYAGAWVPVSAALEKLLANAAMIAVPAPQPTPEIQALVAQVQKLITNGWDDQVASAICLENVAMDRSFAERRKELEQLRQQAGRPNLAAMRLVPADQGGDENGFGRFNLHLPCANGELLASVLCGPPLPIKIQTLNFSLQK